MIDRQWDAKEEDRYWIYYISRCIVLKFESYKEAPQDNLNITVN